MEEGRLVLVYDGVVLEEGKKVEEYGVKEVNFLVAFVQVGYFFFFFFFFIIIIIIIIIIIASLSFVFLSFVFSPFLFLFSPFFL